MSIMPSGSESATPPPLCGAISHWSGVTCQRTHHGDQRHDAEDAYSIYTWTTASVEAEARGECPGCLRRICVCACACDDCQGRR